MACQVLRRWQRSRAHHAGTDPARGNWQRKVAGMDAGCRRLPDLSHGRLLARLRALLRRLEQTRQRTVAVRGHCGGYQPGARALARTSRWCSPATSSLLSHLMQRRGEVLSRTRPGRAPVPDDSERDSTPLRVFIARLRKKLPGAASRPCAALGYRLVDPQRRCMSAWARDSLRLRLLAGTWPGCCHCPAAGGLGHARCCANHITQQLQNPAIGGAARRPQRQHRQPARRAGARRPQPDAPCQQPCRACTGRLTAWAPTPSPRVGALASLWDQVLSVPPTCPARASHPGIRCCRCRCLEADPAGRGAPR